MSEHVASIRWQRSTPDFLYDSYNRAHEWSFDAGITLRASASLAFRGDADCVDPEEALVASLSGCHLLTFLAIAARKRFVVDRYEDDAIGVMTKNEHGKLWVSRVTLRPKVIFSGRLPTHEELAAMHASAHENCFIGQSVKSEVLIEPRE